jgi:HEPN domain-containing protein
MPEKWAQQARYDLETAQAMLASGRLLYVLFCCQQSVEKMLKGVVAKRTGEFPPRVHNLMRLAEIAGLSLDEHQTNLLRELSAHYIQSRYPEEMDAIAAQLSPPFAKRMLERTEEIIAWLSSML